MEPPEAKKDEQYPLLKEGGLKDNAMPAPVEIPTWTVTCAPKQTLIRKCWPEFLTASWLTLILLGSTFIVFYALGMGPCRKSQLLLKYNEEKSANVVFFPHILHRGCNFPLALYSPFLSSMAFTYPNLQFNLLLLADDAMRTYYLPKHSKYGGLLGYPIKDPKVSLLQEEAREFERRNPNVNITFMPLSKFMATTPLKSYWRTIPVSYLSFYIRIFFVWENGGIAMDLNAYNNYFCNNMGLDQRVSVILSNHNEGFPVTDYNVLLQAIDEEEDNRFKILNQILNDTLSMFNSVFSFGDSLKFTEFLPSAETPAKRTQRAKRDVSNFYEIETNNDKNSSIDTKTIVEIKFNVTEDDKIDNKKENNTLDDLMKTESPLTTLGQLNSTKINISLIADQENKSIVDHGYNESKRYPGIMVYDISYMSNRFLSHEPLRPLIPTRFRSNSKRDTVTSKNNIKHTIMEIKLVLALDGLFVASMHKMHSFLGYMLISTNFQKRRPECAIRDAILTQCAGENKDIPHYCNIYSL